MTKKIISIAPSFDCSLSCEGCYLTSDVTQEMKDLVKDEHYFMRESSNKPRPQGTPSLQ